MVGAASTIVIHPARVIGNSPTQSGSAAGRDWPRRAPRDPEIPRDAEGELALRVHAMTPAWSRPRTTGKLELEPAGSLDSDVSGGQEAYGQTSLVWPSRSGEP